MEDMARWGARGARWGAGREGWRWAVIVTMEMGVTLAWRERVTRVLERGRAAWRLTLLATLLGMLASQMLHFPPAHDGDMDMTARLLNMSTAIMMAPSSSEIYHICRFHNVLGQRKTSLRISP